MSKLVLGMGFACGIGPAGRVYCWGANGSGQLGNGTTTNSSRPVSVGLEADAVDLTAGYSHVCALLSNHRTYCWGDNHFSQVGRMNYVESYSTPQYVGVGTQGIADWLEAGGNHSCAGRTDGSIYCWGSDSAGQTGMGGSGNVPRPYPTYPVPYVSASGLAGGGAHTCAVSSGSVTCWGAGYYGVLGPNADFRGSTTPVVVPGATGVKAISSADDHTCVIVIGGSVKCWGSNAHGQLGSASTPSGYVNDYPNVSARPVFATGISGAVSISAGYGTTCAVVSGGAVKCWGANDHGQLGIGSTVESKVPVSVPGISGATAVVAGSGTSCALLAGGLVRCWGDNSLGQFGNGSTANASQPAPAPAELTAVSLSAGFTSTCAITSAGAVTCWGGNSFGQLGIGVADPDLHRPTPVSGLSGVTALASGSEFTCALLSAGTVKCWGRNNYGQLGNGTVVNSSTPVTVSGLTGVASITAGYFHTCARLSSGGVRCWGLNSAGQLGDGTTTNRKTPVAPSSLAGVVQLSAGNEFTCALVSGGAVKCWGRNNNGQLGIGETTKCYNDSIPYCEKVPKPDSHVPVEAVGLTGVTQMASGGYHTCALVAAGAVRCWGYDNHGELGSFAPTGRYLTPTAVPGLTGMLSLTAGDNYTCGVILGGRVKCMGLGMGLDHDAPFIQPGVTNVAKVVGGPSHVCVVLSSSAPVAGGVQCWGVFWAYASGNESGQLGDTLYTDVKGFFLVTVRQ